MTGKLILLVDDNHDIIRLLAKEIKNTFSNYSIIVASNGADACEVAIDRQPDLIVMDWEMPVMSGLEATRKLKSYEETQDIPVIIATGRMTSSEDLSLALAAGAIDYVRKPIDFIELYARMNTAFRIKKQEDEIKTLMQNEIDLKIRQLASSSIIVSEKDNILEQQIKLLERIEQHLQNAIKKNDLTSLEENLKEIKQQKKTLGSSVNSKQSWLSFKNRFEEVHPNFFQKLHIQFGEMTTKELRLCTYIRLGMESYEMANLLGISTESVRTAIYRLKKKIKLPKDSNFRDYIFTLS